MKVVNCLPRLMAATIGIHLKAMPAVILTGARQTGKSTLAQQIANNTREFYSLDDFDTLHTAQESPMAILRGRNSITIDEIQRSPDLLIAVKRAIDQDRIAGRFLLTGSANLLLMQNVTESLAGRASYLNLWPMTRREQLGLQSCGSWGKLLENKESDWIEILNAEAVSKQDWSLFARRGGFPVPAVHSSTDAERAIWFEGYLRTYVERDLRQISSVSSLADFQRLVRSVCLRLGGISNQTELSRDTGIAQPTVHRYLNLLETSCLLVRLTSFFSNRTKRLVKSPKLYWCDTAMALHIAGEDSPTGAHFENLILLDLLAWRDTKTERTNIHYWRTTVGDEVDFVIETANAVIPIETKSSKRVHIGDAKHLRTFRQQYAQISRAGLLIYTGDDVKWLTDDVLAVPWWKII